MLPTYKGQNNNMQTLLHPDDTEIQSNEPNVEDMYRAIEHNHGIDLSDRVVVEDGPDFSVRDRILEGLEIATEYAARLTEADYAAAVIDKLTRSNVRGSIVQGVRTPADVHDMFSAVTDWREVNSNLTEKQISCFEGTLPPEYASRAYAAYASVRELFERYGPAGMGAIQVKAGNHKKGEFYFCTLLKYSTDRITVQLKKDPRGAGYEYLHQWFAGPELSSLRNTSDGDMMVRCGVQIPPLTRYVSKK